MEAITMYAAVPFSTDDDGNVQPGQPSEAQSASQAVANARRFAASHAGALAFSRAGDKGTGEFQDGVLLASFGTVPDDLTEHLSA